MLRAWRQWNFFQKRQKQQFLIVIDSKEKGSKNLVNNLINTLESSRLEYTLLDLAKSFGWPPFKDFSCVVFSTSQLENLSQKKIQGISTYIYSGGGFVSIFPAFNKALSSAIGFSVNEKEFDSCTNIHSSLGVSFADDLFPGLKGLSANLPGAEAHYDFPLSETAGVKIIAQSPSGSPLAWKCNHGQGKAVFWNSMILESKSTRGLIVQSMLSTLDIAVQPIVNVGVIQIDDFPAGFIDRNAEPILSEFGMSMVEFFDKVWLPDLLELGNEFGVSYTFFVPFTYNGLTDPPFNFLEWEFSKVTKKGVERLFSVDSCHKVGAVGELGFHGYNHIPLLSSHWKTKEAMILALIAAMKRWQEDELAPLPTSYVPAMNEFDSMGLAALSEAIPSIATICSEFFGDFATGGMREFGLEPWNQNFHALPRVTFGYEMTPERQFEMLSILATMGVWTHFFHPDDIFDNPDNNPSSTYHRNAKKLKWREDTGENSRSMYGELRNWFSTANKHCPWLRYLKTKPASDLIQKYLSSSLKIFVEESNILICSDQITDFQIRITPKIQLNIQNSSEVKLLHVYKSEDYELFTFRMLSNPIHGIKIPFQRKTSLIGAEI